eukprot:869052_1
MENRLEDIRRCSLDLSDHTRNAVKFVATPPIVTSEMCLAKLGGKDPSGDEKNKCSLLDRHMSSQSVMRSNVTFNEFRAVLTELLRKESPTTLAHQVECMDNFELMDTDRCGRIPVYSALHALCRDIEQDGAVPSQPDPKSQWALQLTTSRSKEFVWIGEWEKGKAPGNEYFARELEDNLVVVDCSVKPNLDSISEASVVFLYQPKADSIEEIAKAVEAKKPAAIVLPTNITLDLSVPCFRLNQQRSELLCEAICSLNRMFPAGQPVIVSDDSASHTSPESATGSFVGSVTRAYPTGRYDVRCARTFDEDQSDVRIGTEVKAVDGTQLAKFDGPFNLSGRWFLLEGDATTMLNVKSNDNSLSSYSVKIGDDETSADSLTIEGPSKVVYVSSILGKLEGVVKFNEISWENGLTWVKSPRCSNDHPMLMYHRAVPATYGDGDQMIICDGCNAFNLEAAFHPGKRYFHCGECRDDICWSCAESNTRLSLILPIGKTLPRSEFSNTKQESVESNARQDSVESDSVESEESDSVESDESDDGESESEELTEIDSGSSLSEKDEVDDDQIQTVPPVPGNEVQQEEVKESMESKEEEKVADSEQKHEEDDDFDQSPLCHEGHETACYSRAVPPDYPRDAIIQCDVCGRDGLQTAPFEEYFHCGLCSFDLCCDCADGQWSCSACTFINQQSEEACEMCGTRKPEGQPARKRRKRKQGKHAEIPRPKTPVSQDSNPPFDISGKSTAEILGGFLEHSKDLEYESTLPVEMSKTISEKYGGDADLSMSPDHWLTFVEESGKSLVDCDRNELVDMHTKLCSELLTKYSRSCLVELFSDVEGSRPALLESCESPKSVPEFINATVREYCASLTVSPFSTSDVPSNIDRLAAFCTSIFDGNASETPTIDEPQADSVSFKSLRIALAESCVNHVVQSTWGSHRVAGRDSIMFESQHPFSEDSDEMMFPIKFSGAKYIQITFDPLSRTVEDSDTLVFLMGSEPHKHRWREIHGTDRWSANAPSHFQPFTIPGDSAWVHFIPRSNHGVYGYRFEATPVGVSLTEGELLSRFNLPTGMFLLRSALHSKLASSVMDAKSRTPANNIFAPEVVFALLKHVNILSADSNSAGEILALAKQMLHSANCVSQFKKKHWKWMHTWSKGIEKNIEAENAKKRFQQIKSVDAQELVDFYLTMCEVEQSWEIDYYAKQFDSFKELVQNVRQMRTDSGAIVKVPRKLREQLRKFGFIKKSSKKSKRKSKKKSESKSTKSDEKKDDEKFVEELTSIFEDDPNAHEQKSSEITDVSDVKLEEKPSDEPTSTSPSPAFAQPDGITHAFKRALSLVWAVTSAAGVDYSCASVDNAERALRKREDKMISSVEKFAKRRSRQTKRCYVWARHLLSARDLSHALSLKPGAEIRVALAVSNELKDCAFSGEQQKCTKGHSLTFQNHQFYRASFSCDSCSESEPCATGCWRCSLCQFDKCIKCYMKVLIVGDWSSDGYVLSLDNGEFVYSGSTNKQKVFSTSESSGKFQLFPINGDGKGKGGGGGKGDPENIFAETWDLIPSQCTEGRLRWVGSKSRRIWDWSKNSSASKVSPDNSMFTDNSIKAVTECLKRSATHAELTNLLDRRLVTHVNTHAHLNNTYPLCIADTRACVREFISMQRQSIATLSVKYSMKAVEWCTDSKVLSMRFALICAFNRTVAPYFGLIDLSRSQDKTNIAGVICEHADLIFFKTKSEFLFGRVFLPYTQIEAENEYEFSVSRAKASTSLERNLSVDVCVQNSLLGQIQKQFAKEQPYCFRAFKENNRCYRIKFMGEGSEDAGGPYRESLSQICSDFTDARLGLCAPVPNAVYALGYNREQCAPVPMAGQRVGDTREYFRFIGQLMGVALRTRQFLDFSLTGRLWKSLLGLPLSVSEDLEPIDQYTVNSLKDLLELAESDSVSGESVLSTLFFVYNRSDDSVAELKPGGANIPVTARTVREFVQLALEMRLRENSVALEAIRDGFVEIVPVDCLQLFTWKELELLVCGQPEIDVALLKANCEYKSGWSESDKTIQHFWKALESFNTDERQKFLRFIWGRSRLPLSSEGFFDKFKIDKSSEASDGSLPIGHTCFFTLDLPEYSTYEVLRERMLYAIENCTAIDMDFTTRDGEWQIDDIDDDDER